MKKLWAPWRMDYIRTPKEGGCVFCDKSQTTEYKKNLVLHQGKESFILMNLYPYSNGHIMISPYEHTSDINEISDTCNNEIMAFAKGTMNILRKVMSAEGFNFGANIGKAGGAGIEEHIHYHIVPRWKGDTNFMPVVGNTKVLVEGLVETWISLKPHFESKFGSINA